MENVFVNDFTVVPNLAGLLICSLGFMGTVIVWAVRIYALLRYLKRYLTE